MVRTDLLERVHEGCIFKDS